jgi:hypothetical protein
MMPACHFNKPSTMRHKLVLSSMLYLISTASVLADSLDAGSGDWQALFNGKNLEEWQVKITGHALGENFGQTFRVEDGLLKIRYDQYESFDGQFGHLFFNQPFSHYALSLTYRFVGEQATGGPRGWAVRNSGVMLHAQAPETMVRTQDFPVSIEAQFLGGLNNGRPRPTANVCTPGTHIVVAGALFRTHCLNSQSPTFDGDQWVTVTVTVLGGGSMTHYVNEQEVLKYSRPQLDTAVSHQAGPVALDRGYIALQSESHPIDFKEVKLLNLAGCTSPSAKNYRPYFVKSEPDKCLY